MAKIKAETEASNLTPLPIPVAPGKQGCAPSFLTQKSNEMDKACGPSQPKLKEEEYVQPDEEKESGGEA